MECCCRSSNWPAQQCANTAMRWTDHSIFLPAPRQTTFAHSPRKHSLPCSSHKETSLGNSGSFSSIPRREARRPGPPFRNSEPYHCDKEKCSESLSSQARSNSQPQSGSHCQVVPWSRNNLSNMGGRPQDSEPVPLPRSLQASPLGGAGW